MKRTGWVMVVIAACVMIVSAAAIALTVGPAFWHEFSGPTRSVPATINTHLDPGRYGIYERVGTQESGGPVTITNENGVTIALDQVTVDGPDGQVVTPYVPSDYETINRNGQLFALAAAFHARVAGQYQVTISTESGAQVFIARDLGDLIESILGWIAAGFGGFLLLVAAVIVLIVDSSRRRREARAFGPGPGWYPDPFDPSRPRWWDGAAWAYDPTR